MPDLLVATTLLLVLGAILLARDAGRIDRSPFLALGGLGLVAFALVARFFTSAGPLAILGGLFVDAGIGLLAVAAVLALRRRRVRGALASAAVLLVAGYGLLFVPRLVAGSASGSLLVELGPDDHPHEIAGHVAAAGGTLAPVFPRVPRALDADLAQVYRIDLPAGRADALAEQLRFDRENVDHVEANGWIGLQPVSARSPVRGAGSTLANDPLASEQWALEAAGVHRAHALLRDAHPEQRSVVAILDTGVDGAHADLGGVLRTGGANADVHGHGTHCAGIAGAATHNGVGIASLNWEGRFVEVVSYQALPRNGMGTYDRIAGAIVEAVLDGADVLSMSLGEQGRTAPKVVRDAVAFAVRRGVVVVASAGNASRDGRDHMPSNLPGVVAVAAVTPELARAPFSNTVAGMERPIAAPGVGILSLRPGDGYVENSGTSMAAPFVAGLLGVLRSLDPSLSADALYALAHDTGRDLPASAEVGRLVDAEAAVRAVLARRPAPVAARQP